jgi:hypothetical protein
MRKAGAASTLEQAKLEYGPGPPSYYWAETLGHIKNYIVIAHKQEAVFDDASGWNLGIVARLVFFICLDKLGADSAAADTIHLEIRGSNFEPEMLKDWKDNGFKTRHWRADHGDRNKQMGESDKHWADEAWDNICDENYMASFYTICGGPAIKVVEASRSRERPAVPSSVLRLTL